MFRILKLFGVFEYVYRKIRNRNKEIDYDSCNHSRKAITDRLNCYKIRNPGKIQRRKNNNNINS